MSSKKKLLPHIQIHAISYRERLGSLLTSSVTHYVTQTIESCFIWPTHAAVVFRRQISQSTNLLLHWLESILVVGEWRKVVIISEYFINTESRGMSIVIEKECDQYCWKDRIPCYCLLVTLTFLASLSQNDWIFDCNGMRHDTAEILHKFVDPQLGKLHLKKVLAILFRRTTYINHDWRNPNSHTTRYPHSSDHAI